MANPRYASQSPLADAQKSAKGVMPLKGEPQKSELNLSSPNWGGLPGKTGPDRRQGIPAEKIYAQAVGIAGGADEDDKGGSSKF